MRRTSVVMVLILAVGLTGSAWAGGGSTKPKTKTTTETELTPEQEAIETYNMGIASRNKAWKLEDKLASATSDAEREKLQAKITKTYKTAAASFQRAIRKNGEMFEAHSDLGYCLRKQGDYEGSLAAYDRALEIQPKYAEAIEYRGEAYLGLNRLDEAKKAYMTLFKGQSDQAPALLEAMQEWVAERSANPGGADAADVEAFSAWVAERAEIAGHSKSVSQLKDADW